MRAPSDTVPFLAEEVFNPVLNIEVKIFQTFVC